MDYKTEIRKDLYKCNIKRLTIDWNSMDKPTCSAIMTHFQQQNRKHCCNRFQRWIFPFWNGLHTKKHQKVRLNRWELVRFRRLRKSRISTGKLVWKPSARVVLGLFCWQAVRAADWDVMVQKAYSRLVSTTT